MNRRRFIKKTMATMAGVGGIAGLYAWQVEPFWIEFVKKKMEVAHLPRHLEGKTLMQISDVHVGNRFDYGYIMDSFQKAQMYAPDFVVYTGDYVTYEGEKQLEQLEEVLKYAVRGSLATVGILGNHDYGKNWDEPHVGDKITSLLHAHGIDVLRNEQRAYDGLHFIGFDDYWGPNFVPKAAMVDVDNDQAHIVLCHNPDVCDLDVWSGYRGWILSGHTHGGQCKPPFLKPPLLPVQNKRYTSGEIDLGDGRMLYINRALGHLMQLRFNVRPEITIFELQRA